MKKINMTIVNIIYVISGVLLLSICSQTSIPMDPVPLTLQTVGVMLIGLYFKNNHAITIMALYLTFGTIGAPIFSNYGHGLQTLLGPRGGYLFGFLVAVTIMNYLKKHLSKNNFIHTAFNCLIGTMTILLCGVSWLAYYIGIENAVNKGLYPFIIPGIIKVIFTTLIYYFFNFMYKTLICKMFK